MTGGRGWRAGVDWKEKGKPPLVSWDNCLHGKYLRTHTEATKCQQDCRIQGDRQNPLFLQRIKFQKLKKFDVSLYSTIKHRNF